MNMKTILFTIFSILAVLSLTGCSASGAGKADDTLDEQVDHIEVIYFHGNMRCLTCRAIEKFAHETVDSLFKDEVNSEKVLFRVVSIPENEAMADDYQTTGSSLFVTSFINGKETRKNMTEFGFKTARKNHVLFQDSLANVIRQSLENIRP